MSLTNASVGYRSTALHSSALWGVEAQAASSRAVQLRPRTLVSQLSLTVCDEGATEVGWGRQVQVLTAGSVLVRAPYHVSTVVQRGAVDTSCRALLIEPQLIPFVASEVQRLLPFGSVVTRLAPVVDGFRALWNASTSKLPVIDQQARLDSLMLAVADLLTRVVAPLIISSSVARARDAIHEHFDESLSLGQLAAVAGVSKCHLVHLFHNEIGLPPHTYQIHLRVARARVLVAGGTPLGEVASMVGFADQSHMTRLFKRVVGMPPGRYASSIGARSLLQEAS